jgi:hypothetical protein
MHYSVYASRTGAVNAAQALEPRPAVNPYAWSWGAALCSTWWAFRNKCWAWAIICLINLLMWAGFAIYVSIKAVGGSMSGDDSAAEAALMLLAMIFALGSIGFWFCKTIYLGVCGNRLAIRYGRYSDEEALRSSMRKWNIGGGLIGVFSLILLIVDLIWASLQ